MQWWFLHQPFLLGYIFENVPLLGDFRDKVLDGCQYICQHLRDLIFVNAASLDSYADRPWWIWTNLASLSTLIVAFSAVPPSFDQKVDDILDPNRTSLPVVRDDLSPLALVNKVGTPQKAFPTFTTFPLSFAFYGLGSGMMWDAHTKTHTKLKTRKTGLCWTIGCHATWNKVRVGDCRAPLHEDCPKHHGHKGDPGVTLGTCGAIGNGPK